MTGLVAMRNLAGCLLFASMVVLGSGQKPNIYPMEGCKAGWTNFGKFCYRFFNQRTNWLDAQRACRRYSALPGVTPTGFVATPKDSQQNNFLHNWLHYTGGAHNKVWLGLAERTNNYYVWADGTPLMPIHWNLWKTDQPQLNSFIQAVHTFDNLLDKTWSTSFFKTEMTYICQYQYRP